MNEKNKMLVVISIIVFISLCTVGFALSKSKNMENLYNDFQNVLKSNEKKLIYIGSKDCGYCQLLNPSIEDMKERYHFDYLHIDINDINQEYMDKILKDLNIKEFGTPYLVIVQNGKVLTEQRSYLDYDKTFEFLQKNEIIGKDEKLLLNYIDYNTYDSLLKGKEKSIVVLGQSRCIHCVHAKVELNKVVEEEKININYLNIEYIKEEEREKFENSLEYLKNPWGTPLTLIVQDGKLIDKLEGGYSKENYIEFFKKNGVIK